HKPGNKFITRCKIGGSMKLMHCPLLLYFIGDFIRPGKAGSFYHMGQLKNNAQCKPTYYTGNQQTKQYFQPAKHQYRDYYIYNNVRQFGKPENKMFFQWHRYAIGLWP